MASIDGAEVRCGTKKVCWREEGERYVTTRVNKKQSGSREDTQTGSPSTTISAVRSIVKGLRFPEAKSARFSS